LRLTHIQSHGGSHLLIYLTTSSTFYYLVINTNSNGDINYAILLLLLA